MKRKKLKLPTIEEPETCCWCSAYIEAGQPVWALFIESFFELYPKGEWIEIELLSGERIVGGIIGKHSQARKTGSDMFFEVCSPDCAKKLKVALEQNTKAFLKEIQIKPIKK